MYWRLPIFFLKNKGVSAGLSDVGASGGEQRA
jgi:hypothetical protein